MNKAYLSLLTFSCIYASELQQFSISNETTKPIKHLEATFVFKGPFQKKDKAISERDRVEGTLNIQYLNPGETLPLDPYQATKVGVVEPVANYFREPTIYLRRVTAFAPRAHKKFANILNKYGTRSKRDLVIYANKYDKLFITTRENYDNMMGIKTPVQPVD